MSQFTFCERIRATTPEVSVRGISCPVMPCSNNAAKSVERLLASNREESMPFRRPFPLSSKLRRYQVEDEQGFGASANVTNTFASLSGRRAVRNSLLPRNRASFQRSRDGCDAGTWFQEGAHH
jgi:hypothetical protein